MISYLANPQRFLKFAKVTVPVFILLTVTCLIFGVYKSLFDSPVAENHLDGVRIMYVHVPAAWLSMLAYAALAMASFVSFVWRHNLADYGARAFARLGVVFTALCLVTGAIWGQAAWGKPWVWDVRMTSVLILFFMFVAYLLLWVMIEDQKRARRLAAIFAMVGLINLPIIKFSVEFLENQQHQAATVSNFGSPGLVSDFYIPLTIMMIAYTSLFAWLAIVQVRTDIRTAQSKRIDRKTPKITIEDV